MAIYRPDIRLSGLAGIGDMLMLAFDDRDSSRLAVHIAETIFRDPHFEPTRLETFQIE